MARIGMVVFAIGLAVILVIGGMFASGVRDFPVWLNLATVLAPIGIGLGLIAFAQDAQQVRGAAR